MSLGFSGFSSLVLSGIIAVVTVAPSQAAITAPMNREQLQQQAQEHLQQQLYSRSSGGSSSTPSRRPRR